MSDEIVSRRLVMTIDVEVDVDVDVDAWKGRFLNVVIEEARYHHGVEAVQGVSFAVDGRVHLAG